jgi:hypothetical protein
MERRQTIYGEARPVARGCSPPEYDNVRVKRSVAIREGAVAPRPRKRRRRRRDALVHQHLEGVSRHLIERHPDLVRQFIGRNAGVYALYRKNKLYYVGLATGLRGRLKAHIKNRHGKSWDHFSIYLTIRDQHLREIEALIHRIAAPPGGKQRGKLAQSKDMRRTITRAIREKQDNEVISLFGKIRRLQPSRRSMPKNGDNKLVQLLPVGARLRGTLKGKIYKALARRDGRVRYNGKYYSSLTLAAVAAIKRPTNGWWFWKIKRGGQWVRLIEIRKAGTPVYAR